MFASVSDYYVHFVLGEGYLEAYAKEHKVSEQQATPSSPQEKDMLSDASRHLKVVLKENGKVIYM